MVRLSSQPPACAFTPPRGAPLKVPARWRVADRLGCSPRGQLSGQRASGPGWWPGCWPAGVLADRAAIGEAVLGSWLLSGSRPSSVPLLVLKLQVGCLLEPLSCCFGPIDVPFRHKRRDPGVSCEDGVIDCSKTTSQTPFSMLFAPNRRALEAPAGSKCVDCSETAHRMDRNCIPPHLVRCCGAWEPGVPGTLPPQGSGRRKKTAADAHGTAKPGSVGEPASNAENEGAHPP